VLFVAWIKTHSVVTTSAAYLGQKINQKSNSSLFINCVCFSRISRVFTTGNRQDLNGRQEVLHSPHFLLDLTSPHGPIKEFQLLISILHTSTTKRTQIVASVELRNSRHCSQLFKLVTLKKKGRDDCRAQSPTAYGPLLVHLRTCASEIWCPTASGDNIVNSQNHIRSFHRRFDRI